MNKVLYFLKNYTKYEYATRDGKHFAASLIFHALQYICITLVGAMVAFFVIKLLFVLGVFH